jgi:hypothetical protein
MDPLSVSASIAGLLTAAQQVSSVVGMILASKKTGSQEIKNIKITVDTLRSVLLQLQLLLLGRASVNPQRASLILLDQVVVTLTACVMTFSDLDGCVKEFFSMSCDENLDLLASIRWASKATEVRKHLRNLEAHKSSFTLMISILTW